MELELWRTYFPNGTNGELYYEGKRLCFTIERPWLGNKRQVSCIPEGRYRLVKRYTQPRGWHLMVQGVKGRTGILIHPANDALRELEGCLAPVSLLTAEGKGVRSRAALNAVHKVVFPALERKEVVFLSIKCCDHEID